MKDYREAAPAAVNVFNGYFPVGYCKDFFNESKSQPVSFFLM